MFLKKGDAAKVIIETAKAENCGLIVLGSRGRGEFTELLLGSVSHKVIQHATGPVLLVKGD
jgi:nucleotide-binding universal stress UspA family protein